MKLSKIAIISLLFSAQVFATSRSSYEVTITNLTKGQPLTPAVIAIGNSSFNLYRLGHPATVGLRELARDGKTQDLLNEFSANQDVLASATGSGLIFPGMSETIKFKANRRGLLSLASMLAKTNDAFIGKKKVSLNINKGGSVSFIANVYDAGVEINNESKDFIPAFGSSEVNTTESEGFVHPHPGIYGIADLNPVTDAFARAAALVTIKRMD